MKWVSLMKIRHKMAAQQQKRHTVADSLHAKVKAKSISDIVGVSLKTMYNIKKAMTTEYGIKKMSGSGGSKRKRNPEFFDGLKSMISEVPTTLMKKLAGELSVGLQAIWIAVHQNLGLKSFVLTKITY